jgi:hypothetical protein
MSAPELTLPDPGWEGQDTGLASDALWEKGLEPTDDELLAIDKDREEISRDVAAGGAIWHDVLDEGEYDIRLSPAEMFGAQAFDGGDHSVWEVTEGSDVTMSDFDPREEDAVENSDWAFGDYVRGGGELED